LRESDGAEYRLFNLFRDPRAILLAFGSGGIAAKNNLTAACIVGVGDQPHRVDGVRRYRDPRQLAHSIWGIRCPTLPVVRPDDIIGFAPAEFNVNELPDQLCQAGLMFCTQGSTS